MQVDFKIRLDKKILNACTCTHAHTKPDMLVHVRHPSAAMVKRKVEAGDAWRPEGHVTLRHKPVNNKSLTVERKD